MAIPDKGIKLIAEGIKTRTEAGEAILTQLDDIERAIFRAVMREVNALSASKDGLRLTAANAKRLNKLEKEIGDIVRTGKYKKSVSDYLREFDGIEALAMETHGVISGLKIPKDFFKDIKQHSIAFAEGRLIGEGFSEGWVKPLMDKVANSILTGGQKMDIAEILEAHISNSPTSLKKYVGQIATDTVNQYAGAMDQRTAREFGLEWYVYQGSVIKTTRPQCRDWVGGQYLHVSELPAEIARAYSQGSGMIPGTTPSNFAVNRGGYNCRHAAVPIATELVPEAYRQQL